DQLAVLNDERHAPVPERLRRLQEPHRGALGTLEHRAGRDRDAELEPEVDRQHFEIDEAVLDQNRSESGAVARLVAERRLQLRFRQPAVADEHLAELHLVRRYHAPLLPTPYNGPSARLAARTAPTQLTWYCKRVTTRVAIAVAVTVSALGCGSKD